MTQTHKLFWGETHHNTYQRAEQHPGLDTLLTAARQHLDFYAAAYYMCRMDPVPLKETASDNPIGSGKGHPGDLLRRGKGDWRGLFYEYQKNNSQLNREWKEVEAATLSHNEPGRFVTFPGFEWQGDLTWGDHNVFYKNEGSSIYPGGTLAGLYEHIRNRDGLAIPHHSAYRPGCRAPRWDHCDERLSPFVEIYSVHGSSERDGVPDGLRANGHMGPGIGGSTYEDALRRGLHVGAIASTDNWTDSPGRWGDGLMGCWAEELTRESLWEAFLARRVYAVTGDRIQLQFTCGDHPMGSIIPRSTPPVFKVSGIGCDAIDRVEILRNDHVISIVSPGTRGGDPSGSARGRFRLRIEAGWGPKPGEIPTGDKQWNGKMALSDGQVTDWEPCWLHTGQRAPSLSDSSVEFAITSPQEQAGEPFQNGFVFEFESTLDGWLSLKINDRLVEYRVADLLASSQLVGFEEESMEQIRKHTTWEKETFPRWTTPFSFAHKVRLSQAVPIGNTAFEVEAEDECAPDGNCYYRARVIQRNGQRAWSSPIWFE